MSKMQTLDAPVNSQVLVERLLYPLTKQSIFIEQHSFVYVKLLFLNVVQPLAIHPPAATGRSSLLGVALVKL